MGRRTPTRTHNMREMTKKTQELLAILELGGLELERQISTGFTK